MKIGTSTVTAIYLGTTSIVSAYLGSTQVFGGSFTPLDLFSGGAQGIWLDPSDLSTMFSDRAGTIQVTTPGTVVGKRLDKSGRGNHATAPTDAARPIYGVEPKGGRRNLLTYSEAFSESVWTKLNATVTANTTAAPDGTTTADTLTDNATSGSHYAQVLNVFVADGLTRFWTVYVKQGTSRYVSLTSYDLDTTASTSSRITFDMQDGVYTAQGAEADTVLTPVDAGSGWWRIGFSSNTNAARYDGFRVEMNSDGTNTGASYSGTGSTVFIWGAQLELGSTATAYQRVTTAYDVTESGVATCHYVQYDGSDDSMSTAAINFTGTDKMSVFAGVRKNVDSPVGMIAELSTNASLAGAVGSFFFVAGTDAGGVYSSLSRGSAAAAAGQTTYTTAGAAPDAAVLTVTHDIAGDLSTIRRNGATGTNGTADKGTGNFGNYPLFIGRRNNATLPFNGKDYGIIVVGKAASAGEITDTETWLAAKTSGVTI